MNPAAARPYEITLLEHRPDGTTRELFAGRASAFVIAVCAAIGGELRIFTHHEGPAEPQRDRKHRERSFQYPVSGDCTCPSTWASPHRTRRGSEGRRPQGIRRPRGGIGDYRRAGVLLVNELQPCAIAVGYEVDVGSARRAQVHLASPR
jgi:hypothetical protein